MRRRRVTDQRKSTSNSVQASGSITSDATVLLEHGKRVYRRQLSIQNGHLLGSYQGFFNARQITVQNWQSVRQKS
jgi:hypothetical protein